MKRATKVVLASLLIIFTNCNKDENGSVTYSVKYTVDSNYELNLIRYTDTEGVLEYVGNPPLNWTRTLEMKSGQKVNISAETKTNGFVSACKTVRVEIYVNGNIEMWGEDSNLCNTSKAYATALYQLP